MRSSGPSWSAIRSLLRTGFCAEAAAAPPPPPPLLPAPVPLLLWMLAGAEVTAVGLKPAPGVGDGEEEADDGGEPGAGPVGEVGAGGRDTALGRLWSFMVPLGRGRSS